MTAQIIRALADERASVRLQAAMAAGTDPDSRLLDALIDRCRVEPDFYVRDMLTWAITRLPGASTVPVLVREIGSSVAQARSQALHSLSKVGDHTAWPFITRALLTDADVEVARAAWRAAVILVPADQQAELAAILATQFGRGDTDVHRSLSRAFVELGSAAAPVVRFARRSTDPIVRGHAAATEQLMNDPESAFGFDVDAAKRIAALGAAADDM
ncbi:HEAT repeat domain-containing protein [Gordonia sp. PDNC005]|uniref:HEAT repeat domain-containing protein n=1 Tax=unclassified Gordonia (in: high G+C Gram-positive bacteria) TaxID=2657482 RepID=UPI001966C348|nr:HEAT repeat domain-containing protein [Gordonia sp. PDNC005]QRY62055.1 HEAT repeat domain-containing protein [Gordonia sp. PDNC005]